MERCRGSRGPLQAIARVQGRASVQVPGGGWRTLTDGDRLVGTGYRVFSDIGGRVTIVVGHTVGNGREPEPGTDLETESAPTGSIHIDGGTTAAVLADPVARGRLMVEVGFARSGNRGTTAGRVFVELCRDDRHTDFRATAARLRPA